MIDPRVAAIDAERQRVVDATTMLAIWGVVYFLFLIFVLSQFGRFLGDWGAVLFLPVPGIGIAITVLRIKSSWLGTDAALEQMRVTNESLDSLDEAIAEAERRERRDERDERDGRD
jgi:hypothetical protein